MAIGSRLTALLAAGRERPVAVALELGTLVGVVVLFAGTVLALAGGPPANRAGPYVAVIVLGTAIVLLWTVVVPVYDRLSAEDGQ